MPYKWTENYETGEERVDRQHQTLFKMINDLEVMLEKPTITDQDVGEAIRWLTNYTRIHFVYEEFCMVRHSCPVWEKNQFAHDKFTAALDDFKAEFDVHGGSRRLLQRIYKAAGQWLIHHICKIDKNLRQSLPA